MSIFVRWIHPFYPDLVVVLLGMRDSAGTGLWHATDFLRGGMPAY